MLCLTSKTDAVLFRPKCINGIRWLLKTPSGWSGEIPQDPKTETSTESHYVVPSGVAKGPKVQVVGSYSTFFPETCSDRSSLSASICQGCIFTWFSCFQKTILFVSCLESLP